MIFSLTFTLFASLPVFVKLIDEKLDNACNFSLNCFS